MKRVISIVLSVLMVILPLSACGKGTDMDPEKYSNYVCYDSLLTCIGDISETVVIKRDTGRTYRFTYCKIPDVSDDQFIFATMFPVTIMLPLMNVRYDEISYVFQNPENYINIWEEWTVKEIQVYFRDSAQRLKDREEKSRYARPTEIIATTNDEACIRDILNFVTSDEFVHYSYETMEKEKGINLFRADLDGNSELQLDVTIRVLFNETESIVWDTELEAYLDSDTGNWYFLLDKDTTSWDVTDNEYGIYRLPHWVENLPSLEAFLMEAVQTLREGME